MLQTQHRRSSPQGLHEEVYSGIHIWDYLLFGCRVFQCPGVRPGTRLWGSVKEAGAYLNCRLGPPQSFICATHLRIDAC